MILYMNKVWSKSFEGKGLSLIYGPFWLWGMGAGFQDSIKGQLCISLILKVQYIKAFYLWTLEENSCGLTAPQRPLVITICKWSSQMKSWALPFNQALYFSSCVPPKIIRKQHRPCVRPCFPSKLWPFLTKNGLYIVLRKRSYRYQAGLLKWRLQPKKFSEIFIFVNIECAAILRLWRDINDYFKPKEEIFWCVIFTLFKCLSKFDLDIIKKHFNSMGTIVSFQQNNDKATEMQKAAKQALDISLKLINTRFEAFETQLNLGVGAIKKVPGQYLISTKKIISCNVSQGTQANRTAISGIASDLANGYFAGSITDTLFRELDIILGSFQCSYEEYQDYILLTNQVGGVYRIDYLVINQKLTATGITSGISSVFGSYLIVSSVLKSELKDNDNVYRILVSRQFPDRSLFIKFILIKLLKEEQLTTEERKLVEDLAYEPLRFNAEGELVGRDGHPIYPRPMRHQLKQEAHESINFQMPQRGANDPQEDLIGLSQYQRLERQISKHSDCSFDLKRKIKDMEKARDNTIEELNKYEQAIKDMQLQSRTADLKVEELNILLEKQAQNKKMDQLVKLAKELIANGAQIQALQEKILEAVRPRKEHAESPPAEDHS